MEQISPVLSLNGAQHQLSLAGTQIVVKVSAQQTGGDWSLLEYTAPANQEGPAPHFHKILEETFYVVEGTLSLLAGDEWVEATAGSAVVVPPYTVHTFANRTNTPVRFLLLLRPGGFEQYFEEIITLRKQEPVWPPQDKSKLLALMEQYDTFSPMP